jgi:hypothetical protein
MMSFILKIYQKAYNKLPFSIWFFCVFFIIAGFCGCAGPDNLIVKSGNWDRIRYGEYFVENCTWNVGAAHGKWSESIFCDTTKGSMGWKWDFSNEMNGENAYVCKTYPEIIFGRKPFDVYKSTTPRLPVKLDSAFFRLEYDYSATFRSRTAETPAR